MKKYQLTGLAALGFLSAIVQIEAAKDSSKNIKRTQNMHDDDQQDSMDMDMDQDNEQCTLPSPNQERKLLSQLNADSRSLYNSLDCEGKTLAVQLAEQKCKGQNECKGLNSCHGAKNDCPGKGECKGTAQGPFKDKNVAVQVAAKYMSEKRARMYYNDNYNQQNKSKFNNRYGY